MGFGELSFVRDKAFAGVCPGLSCDEDSCAMISWTSTSEFPACELWISELRLFESSVN